MRCPHRSRRGQPGETSSVPFLCFGENSKCGVADNGTKRANDDRVEKGGLASGTQRLQNGLVFGDLIISGGHQRVVAVLEGHRKIDNHGLATLLSQDEIRNQSGGDNW
ncbi:hypothetical protein TNCT_482961 [Trichonephila clavata]|uniref:Uncharacterized protein n=1 Tax=Trichonephila clavata TaxID=2740835 RepID=A0A8X6EWC4_TRICU|nr:hypothetical protein TNCT_482961 [Trichonephila clavata]